MLQKPLGGAEAANAQKGLGEHHPGAEKLLMQIETAVNGELIRRLETPIRQAVEAAPQQHR